MLLDNLRDIFLKALQYTPALEQKAMIDLWNKECDSIWKDKEALIKETRAVCCAGISPEEIAHAKDLLSAEKDGRLVTLPVGKIGDIVEWDSGVCKELFLIRGIVIYVDGTRYDLGEFMPVVTDEHICRIIQRAEAEKVLGKEAQP